LLLNFFEQRGILEYEAFSGPYLVSRSGDAGWTDR